MANIINNQLKIRWFIPHHSPKGFCTGHRSYNYIVMCTLTLLQLQQCNAFGTFGFIASRRIEVQISTDILISPRPRNQRTSKSKSLLNPASWPNFLLRRLHQTLVPRLPKDVLHGFWPYLQSCDFDQSFTHGAASRMSTYVQVHPDDYDRFAHGLSENSAEADVEASAQFRLQVYLIKL